MKAEIPEGNEPSPPIGVGGSSDQLGLVMRNVRRLQRHMDEWTQWYGRADVLLRNQLPLPPAGTVRVLEDLEEAIQAAKVRPLTFAELDAAARDAQIKFCLKSGGSFEEEFARAIERAHGIGA